MVKFHGSLKRFNVKTFETLTKYVVKCKYVQATVEISRNILGSLLPLLLCVCVCVFLKPTFSFQITGMLSGVRLTPSFPK